MRIPRPELAEALGTFFLVLVGCGAVATNAATGALGTVGVAVTFAFVVAILVYAMGHVCGAHYNPAITLAFAITGHFPWRRVLGYWLAQAVGATAGAFALRALLGTSHGLGSTLPSVGPMQAFALELLATFLLAFVIVAVATDRRAAAGAAGLAIGLAVGVDALAFGSLTGASMNPARTLGPALAEGRFDGRWIYITAPFLGAALAMLAYERLRRGSVPAEEPARAGLGPIAPDAEEDLA